MSICSVCYENCRSRCDKCGKSLCAKCKPKGRGKCPVCPTSSRSNKSQAAVGNAYYTPTNSQAQAAYSAAQPATSATSSRSSTRPPVRPPLPAPRDYEAMPPQEVARHTLELAHRLELKQERELAYLQRRYDRGTFTPTDQAYGQDQILEDELLELLRFLAKQAQSW